MKHLILAAAFVLAGSFSTAHAAETIKEKAAETGHTAKRKMKKGMHRVQEALCAKGDVKCAAEKAKNRVEEGADSVTDKVKSGADSIDNDNDAH